MQGTIVRVDPATKGGVVRSTDGQRYEFDRTDWSQPASPPRVGQKVDFDTEGKWARDIIAIDERGTSAAESAASNGTMLGIASIAGALLGFVPGIGQVLAIIAVVLGVIGRRQAKAQENRTGLRLSTIGLVLACIVIAFYAIVAIGLVAMLAGSGGLR